MPYFIAVWLATILISPVVNATGMMLFTNRLMFNDLPGMLHFWFLSVAIGSPLAVPALAIFYLFNKLMQPLRLHTLLKKTIHAIAGTVLLFITFYLLGIYSFSTTITNDLLWPASYGLTLIAAAFIFTMEREENQ